MYKSIASTISVISATIIFSVHAGEIHGSAYSHTAQSAQSAQLGIEHAQVALPPSNDHAAFIGQFSELSATKALPHQVPVVVFLHGSSGINPKLGYDTWQSWLASEGIASIIFDSMQLADRMTYKSPIARKDYEKVQQLRASEIDIVLKALADQPWVDKDKLLLAGTSEGAVSVARYDGDAFKGKMIYSWSCEDNYFVDDDKTSLKTIPTLNIISQKDKYFSDKNEFIGLDDVNGNCQNAFGVDNEQSEVLLIPNAPHTLINLPAARAATLGFIEQVLDPEQKHAALNAEF